MARHVGVSKATVQRVWSTNDIKPHRTRIFKLSCDEQFEAKFWDVIGVYLDPPDNAVVLCCDEKSQCQALQRSQPGLPLGQGHFRTVTHDYYRHGTVTLFAALDYLSGKVISQVAPRHRHNEWLKFFEETRLRNNRRLKRMFEKSQADARRLRIRRVAAMSISVSEVCTLYS